MDSSKISAFLLIFMLFISSAAPILGCGSCNNPPKKKPHKKPPKRPPVTRPPIVRPPVTRPPIVRPPITVPPVRPPTVKPPITVPPVLPKPPITIPPLLPEPPIAVPPVLPKPPITVPPVLPKPPITIPPVLPKPPITVPPLLPKPPITVPPVLPKPPIAIPPVLPPIVKPLPPINVPPVLPQPPKGGGCTPCTPTPCAEATCPIDTLKLGACVDLLGGLVHIGVGDPVVNQCCPVLAGLVEIEAAVCLCTTLKLKVLNLSVYVPLALQLLVTCGKTPPPAIQVEYVISEYIHGVPQHGIDMRGCRALSLSSLSLIFLIGVDDVSVYSVHYLFLLDCMKWLSQNKEAIDNYFLSPFLIKSNSDFLWLQVSD